MKKLALILLLVLVSTPAWAEWTRVGGGDNFDTYADFATIRKRGNTVKMWTLYDFKTAQQVGGTPPYLSQKFQQEYDCDGERTRFLAFSEHSGHMGDGNVVYFKDDARSRWVPVPPESVVEALWKVACGKQ